MITRKGERDREGGTGGRERRGEGVGASEPEKGEKGCSLIHSKR